ncbi:MAG: 16S rRNA (cytidine(1402)-2'-O)-methyltransferase [Hyphomicrobiaceae bacterium]
MTAADEPDGKRAGTPAGGASPEAGGRREAAERLAAAIHRQALGLAETPLASGLHIVATPIGNLGDVTIRALATLARADLVCCEDTRHTRRLLERYGIDRPMRPYHEHNAERERPRLIAELGRGARIALVSDAGTPLVSDPGFKLVREAAAAGLAVWTLPGPSAALAALTLAGLPTDEFLFAGFLPARQGARRERIKALAAQSATLIFYEAPSRIAETLADLAELLGASRPAALARELTKIHEEVRRGPLSELATAINGQEVKGECVILVGAGEAAGAGAEEIRQALGAAFARGATLRDAVRQVTGDLAVQRNRVYEIAIALKDGRSDGRADQDGEEG